MINFFYTVFRKKHLLLFFCVSLNMKKVTNLNKNSDKIAYEMLIVTA